VNLNRYFYSLRRQPQQRSDKRDCRTQGGEKKKGEKKRKKERPDEIPSNPMFPLSIGASASVYGRSTNCRPQAIWTTRARRMLRFSRRRMMRSSRRDAISYRHRTYAETIVRDFHEYYQRICTCFEKHAFLKRIARELII